MPTSHCKLDEDDQECDCIIHMTFRRCGGVEVLNTIGRVVAKRTREEGAQKTKEDAVAAMAAGFVGEATVEQQHLLAIHLFAGTIHAMREKQTSEEVSLAMSMLSGGQAYEVKNVEDVLKLAQQMNKAEGPKAN